MIGPSDGLSKIRRQAITSTTDGFLLIRPTKTSFTEFLNQLLKFCFKKIHSKLPSTKFHAEHQQVDRLLPVCRLTDDKLYRL